MSAIVDIVGREIIDSRGNPTIEVDVLLEGGAFGRAAVPSGASTGSHEAIEKRDGEKRYGGKGVNTAVSIINGELFDALSGLDALDQRHIDHAMIDLDGTKTKERLGANSTLGISLAVAKAAASYLEIPLYRYIGGISSNILPVPMMNILNGGAHADNLIDFQEFMIMPVGARTFREALSMCSDVIRSLKTNLKTLGLNINIGDEGGFAPDLNDTRVVLDHLIKSIIDSRLNPGNDICIALDSASTELYQNGKYFFKGENIYRDKDEMIDFYIDLTKNYPIISIEDGMAEDDWEGWQALTSSLGEAVQLVGDDLFVTNIDRLVQGIDQGVANAILIKVNQIGTLSESLDAVEFAHKSGYRSIVSHRSGETEDDMIADIAVATNCGQIKTGSLARSDRTSKYNQLLRIEEELGNTARYYDLSLNK
tara:strand:- start:747 stop:2018 length:1272 start_codon:yes stop_codon:yes gene_type:complete